MASVAAGHKPEPTWNARATGGASAHYVTTLTPIIYLFLKCQSEAGIVKCWAKPLPATITSLKGAGFVSWLLWKKKKKVKEKASYYHLQSM